MGKDKIREQFIRYLIDGAKKEWGLNGFFVVILFIFHLFTYII